MNRNEFIIELYFIKKMKQKEIAKELNISKYIVSRVVTKDTRYEEEKEKRKQESINRHNRKKTESILKKRKKMQDEYAILKKHRAALHHVAGRSAIDQKKIVREQRRWIVTVWRARPTLHSTSRKRVSAFGVICCVRSGLFLLPFSA